MRSTIGGVIAILLAAALATACSSSGSDDGLESGKPVLADLVGTWKNSYTAEMISSGTVIGAKTVTDFFTIQRTGAFTEITQVTTDYTPAYGTSDTEETEGLSGVVSISADGKLSLHVDSTGSCDGIATSIPVADWEPDAYTITYNAALIDGKFYAYAYSRQGEGTDIQGIWYWENNIDYADSSFNDYSCTATLTIDATTMSGVSKTDGRNLDSWVDSYTVKDSSTLTIVHDTKTREQKYALASDRLVIIYNYSEYTKQ